MLSPPFGLQNINIWKTLNFNGYNFDCFKVHMLLAANVLPLQILIALHVQAFLQRYGLCSTYPNKLAAVSKDIELFASMISRQPSEPLFVGLQ